ncbi:MAG: ABC transporter ATP-binding protein [Burkholderiaceae bacterium]
MTTPMLEAVGLYKSFGGVHATDDLHLSVQAGELHAVIGPNGAGKTTLISQLCGWQYPDQGTIRLNGRDITRMPSHRRAQLGMARSFQITSLIMDLSVRDNVALAVQATEGSSFRFVRAVRNEQHIQHQTLQALASVGLAEKADFAVAELSHGEHRRVEMAMALASKAPLLLLDEPMAGLGAEESVKMVDLLQSLKGQRTMVLIEHDMDAVFALADRISVLVAGHIIATDTPEAIRTNTQVLAAYLGEDEVNNESAGASHA